MVDSLMGNKWMNALMKYLMPEWMCNGLMDSEQIDERMNMYWMDERLNRGMDEWMGNAWMNVQCIA